MNFSVLIFICDSHFFLLNFGDCDKINSKEAKKMVETDIKILWEVPKSDNMAKLIRDTVYAAAEVEDVHCRIELSMVITTNAKIRVINRDYRKIDNETDVLSFPGYEKDEWDKLKNTDETAVIGDIVISNEKVIEQANEYGHSFEREFCYLTAHGLLHLMGYDHMNDVDKAIMREKEEEIMKKLNLER